MPLYVFEGKTPTVHPTAFVAPSADLIGDVVVEAGASVWFGAVLRADFGRIVVHEGANVQDGSVLHAGVGEDCTIGAGATIGHACVVHACTIGAEALVANHATVLDGAVVGSRTLVGAGSLVTGGTTLPDGVLAIGTPARVMGPIEGTSAEAWVEGNPSAYQELAQRYLAGFGPA
ncbi:gamma carbonic anhydrase family protein [Nocardioides anomalus]|uniref:Gamma carbonic anhydrase family protein n=1 Tax=Nocardioides anomalus TaxID=2712223 RepID=A0A6G6WK66_9ACTN|nr:gamma carbonic anhydrase family protein [Nocardioides anomalus]QIG45602.1 gamma carbonic anhydrase family protein [Nocardioides anomalus]